MSHAIVVHQRNLLENDIVKLRNRILAVISIGSKCNQALSYDEISLLLPEKSDGHNLEDFLMNDTLISEKIVIKNQLVTLKGYERLFEERPQKEDIAKEKFNTALTFANTFLSTKSYIKLIAVCGSVAYGLANESDDIDFFIVSQKNRMWLTFAKALLLARILNTEKAVNKKKPNFCLSFIADEENFGKQVVAHRDLLFARELLAAKVLAGNHFYQAVLSKTQWIKEALPVFYHSKINEPNGYFALKEDPSDSFLLNLSNTVLYMLLGNYLRFKALLRNITFKKKGKALDLFEAKITKGSCIYNSERYNELEKMYTLI